MTSAETAFRKTYARLVEVDAEAREKWDERDRLLAELAKMVNMGRKSTVIIRLAPDKGLQITNNRRKFCQDGKLFAPAFARLLEWKEVKI